MSSLLALLLTVTAFFSYEVEDPNGLVKTCYYESVYGTHAMTIRAHRICPLSIEVEV